MKYGTLAAALFLVVIGTLQMVGDVAGWRDLRAFGLALQASPAPKVFTAQQGFETFSNRIFIDWEDQLGARHSLEMTPATYKELRGPYNRRNAYGAAVSYGPVLAANDRTRPMLESVMSRAFCGQAPVLHELFTPEDRLARVLEIRLEPRDARNADPRWQTRFTVNCEESRS